MRDDLAALTPESIAALSNWGLVKRATRELEEGARPALEEAPDGTVTGRFPDGTVATLPPGRSLAQGGCTCGSSTVCRHRVALALAYPREAAPPWSPAEVSDDELERFLGKAMMSRARAALARGFRATVEGSVVHLPTCSVRFLAPRELAMARCDCARAGGCEHLALAVWCCRQGSERVEFGARRSEAGGPRASELGEQLLRQGVVHADDLPFARARRELAGMTWALALLDGLEQQVRLYRQGSSHYRAGEAAFALLSLRARLQGVRELSASYVLGQDTAPETDLDHVRLISLGCRRGTTFLADPAGQVLVLEKPGPLRLADLGRGQLVSQGVRRRANRSVVLRRERSKHSAMPLGQAWDLVELSPAPTEPPRMLRPLVLAENFVLLSVSVLEVAYAPGEQAVVALAERDHGGLLRIVRRYEADSPGALDCLARELGQAVQVSGFLHRDELEPVAFRTPDGVKVPDLEEPSPGWDLPLIAFEPPADPLRARLREAWGLCEESLHFGLEQLPARFGERREELAERLREHGLARLAERFEASWDWFSAALRVELARDRLR